MKGLRDSGLVLALAAAGLIIGLPPSGAKSACCYFAAKGKDVQQPGQKVFITWDPTTKEETFTVQPKFEGNAEDFGMVIPTPSRPKLDEMPRDCFKELAVFTILKYREFPQSKLVPLAGFGGGIGGLGGLGGGFGGGFGGFGGFGGMPQRPRPPAVKVLETGIVGSLDYKVLKAGRADDLYRWLKDNKYKYKGDEATLDHYIKRKWFFSVMKIDAMQMKKNKDGSYTGEVTPTRFQFTSKKLVYPLKITQLSVKDRTEALFYVQAPDKMDLPRDWTYQFQWVSMLQNAQGCSPRGDAWLKALGDKTSEILERGEKLGFGFKSGQRPQPNSKGHIATTLEYARRLTAQDIKLLRGEAAYSEKVPNVDQGFRAVDVKDPRTRALVVRVIRARLALCDRVRPRGFLVRKAPAADVRQLKILAGHLKEGQFLTKFRKTFARDEMDEDLLIVPAQVGEVKDTSEYVEILPDSPP